MKSENYPSLSFADWRPTKNTLHLFCQIVGKIRLTLHPRQNHWWHAPLYVSPIGLTTRLIPHGTGGGFAIEFDLHAHRLVITASDGRVETFDLYDGLTVADFYSSIVANLEKLGIHPDIRAIPYEAPSTIPFAENFEDHSYDKPSIEAAHRILISVNSIFEEFRGRFLGKSTPVHLFWHSFDLAYTRFSGRRAPIRAGAGLVEREAYSHEVISFGFWFGDDKVPAPAFYSYTTPEPLELSTRPLNPHTAEWSESNGAHLALLMYDDVRHESDPRKTVLDFLESAYQAGAKLANWDVKELSYQDNSVD